MHATSAESAGRVRPLTLRRIVALAVVLCAAGAAGAQQGEPRARIVADSIDLGELRVGDDARATFEIVNEGQAPLLILDVDSGCKCTVVEYDETIEPGASGTVRARLLTEEVSGPVGQGLLVITNDPASPRIQLTLEAHVIPSVQVLPLPTIYMRSRPGEPVVGRVLIRRDPGASGALALDDIRTSSPLLEATATRLDEPRPRGGGLPRGEAGDWVLEVHFRDDQTIYGSVRESVRFRTGLERQPELQLPIESDLPAPVRLSTSRLVLSAAGTGPAGGTLFASVEPGADPSSLRVSARPDGLRARVQRRTERMFQIDVEWSGGALQDGELRFVIDGARVHLPVEWRGPSPAADRPR